MLFMTTVSFIECTVFWRRQAVQTRSCVTKSNPARIKQATLACGPACGHSKLRFMFESLECVPVLLFEPGRRVAKGECGRGLEYKARFITGMPGFFLARRELSAAQNASQASIGGWLSDEVQQYLEDDEAVDNGQGFTDGVVETASEKEIRTIESFVQVRATTMSDRLSMLDYRAMFRFTAHNVHARASPRPY